MTLDANDLSKVLGILEKIDQGRISPQMPDRIGRFLRQYARGRAALSDVIARHQEDRRADAAISGRTLGTIEIQPLLKPEVRLLTFPLQEVAETVAMSEELGGVINVIMWLKGPVASALYNLLLRNPGTRLTGDYRWTPPARLTPGEAQLEPSSVMTGWQHARCLKAVADDLIRPPHALEYVVDYRLGPPGLKYFRCVCALKRANGWQVLPALAQSRVLEISAVVTEVHLNALELAALLIYREPWSNGWTIVASVPIDPSEAVAHAITWADFRREIDGSAVDAPIVSAIHEAFRASGLGSAEFGAPNLRRSLLPLACDILRRLRGLE